MANNEKILSLKGAVSIDGSNAAQAAAWPPDYEQFLLSNKANIALLAGSRNTGTASVLDVANIIKDSGNNYRLAVDAIVAINAITYSAPATVTIGVADAAAVAANASRRYLLIENCSSNYVSLSFSGAAVLYSGITLAPYGSYEMTINAGNLALGAIRAIASGAGSVLGIQEGI